MEYGIFRGIRSSATAQFAANWHYRGNGVAGMPMQFNTPAAIRATSERSRLCPCLKKSKLQPPAQPSLQLFDCGASHAGAPTEPAGVILTRALADCKPVYKQLPGIGNDAFVSAVSETLKRPVGVTSVGPTADDKRSL
jgi:hypothetical protein